MTEALPTELVSLRELARRTGKDVDTVRRWRDEEGLPVYSLGQNQQAVVWCEYESWLRARRVPTPSATFGNAESAE